MSTKSKTAGNERRKESRVGGSYTIIRQKKRMGREEKKAGKKCEGESSIKYWKGKEVWFDLIEVSTDCIVCNVM